MQVPPATSVTADPDTDTVQTDVVSELKLTVSPEVVDALTGNGAVPNVWFESPAKVIVWLHCTVLVADACTSLALAALTDAVFWYTPQLDVVVALLTCTDAVPLPGDRFPKLQLSVPLAMVHVPGPPYAGLTLQLIPVPAGNTSLNAADIAVPAPVFVTASV